jgi:hypothetical protein
MPVDEVKLPKDIPPGYAGNAEIYSKAGVSEIDSPFVFMHAYTILFDRQGRNPYTDHMIRERVARRGECRPLEPPSDLPGMNIPLEEIGVIKEGPVSCVHKDWWLGA